jgi:SAM-dependent methyltransferase
LYDVLNPWGPSDDFYLELVIRAKSALDVGCGTGLLLHRAREAGHRGRLCGVDPDRAVLGIARQRADVEWVESKAARIEFEREFELALMTGHAFQTLVEDAEVRSSLDAIRRALVPGGHFVFETRNPLRRAWEDWAGVQLEAVDQHGRELLVWYEIQAVVGDVVTLTETTGSRDRKPLRIDSGSLRFLSAEGLDGFLAESGFVVEERFGGWQREPFRGDSEEIITVARGS